ncbi:hypothetical protein [Shivajiella indica]|uniref:Uncharacterized protein n=1 Tax=Shivajiella indica TaxID=872115 RepID=A0ABW5B5F2_9BACT
MKIHLKSALVMMGIVAMTLSCQEKNDENPVKIAAQVDEVVNILADEFLTLEIQGGDENQAFGLRIIEEENGTFSSKLETEKPNHPKTNLENCINSIELTETQTQEIRETFIGLFECRLENFQAFREDVLEIIKALEAHRLEMLTKLFREEITRDEFKNSMLELKERYKGELEEIRDKHKENLKPCLKGFVESLRETLGQEDWEKLVSCLKK